MLKFKIEPRTYTNKDGQLREAKNIVLMAETAMGHLELPVRAVFTSDSKLLEYAVANEIAGK